MKASVLVRGDTGAVVRGFNKLPGGTAPPIGSRVDIGKYVVDFGANISQLYLQATIRNMCTDEEVVGSRLSGEIVAGKQDFNANQVYIRTSDSAGNARDTAFYLMVC